MFFTCMSNKLLFCKTSQSDLHHFIQWHTEEEDPSTGISVCQFSSNLPQYSDWLHLLDLSILTTEQKYSLWDKLTQHILSCTLVLGASTTWQKRVNCSEIGHDDKLFATVRWQRYKFFFLSCLLALMPDQEKRRCCEFHDKMFYPPLTFTEEVSGGYLRWKKAPCVNWQVCHWAQWRGQHEAPSVLQFSSFFWGHSLAGLWQQQQIRKWLSIMDSATVQFMFLVAVQTTKKLR